jgi:Bardet-Biedl syndrome 9 protein
MFLVKESGVILQHRVLDRPPACAFAFRPNGAPFHHLLLANHDGTVQVYCFFQLAWAAKTDRPPVQLGVGDFGGQKGLIVQVDDGGRLSLSYLGTKPPTTSAVSQGLARELDYNKVEEEHRALLHVIRESQSDRKSEPRERLLIRSQIPRSLDFEPVSTDVELPPNLASLPRGGIVKVSVRVFLSYSGAQASTDVSLSVRAPAFVHVIPSSVVVKSLSGAKSTPVIVRLVFLANAELLPNGLEAEVAASYLSPSGEPRVSSHKLLLPLFLACRLRGASKAAQYKLTLDTAAAAIPLTELFADMVAASGDAGVSAADLLGSTAAQAMGFQVGPFLLFSSSSSSSSSSS